MKGLFNFAGGLFLAGLLSVGSVSTASAQHRGGGFSGGGGGGFRSSGGGGGWSRSSIGMSTQRTPSIGSRTLARGSSYAGTSVASHGAFAYNRGGFYRTGYGYYGYPHLGFYLNVLPFGYYPFYWGDDLYYYSGGVFYRPYDGGGYEVTTPPVGAAVPNVPDGARSIVIDGQQFYELNGVYYKAIVNDEGKKVYVVAGKDGVLNTDNSDVTGDANTAPKVGDIVNDLPDGCRKVSLNGKKYYVSPNGIYYQPYVDENGDTGYRIASIQTDDDDQ